MGLVTIVGVFYLLQYRPGGDRSSAPDPIQPTQAAPTSTVVSGPVVPQPPVGAGRPVLGRVVSTQWGSIQVQLTVSGGRITSARAVRVPEIGGRQGERINTRAIPLLDNETVRAQTAGIDTVSGATVSSTGYRASLQSAIDAAHLA